MWNVGRVVAHPSITQEDALLINRRRKKADPALEAVKGPDRAQHEGPKVSVSVLYNLTMRRTRGEPGQLLRHGIDFLVSVGSEDVFGGVSSVGITVVQARQGINEVVGPIVLEQLAALDPAVTIGMMIHATLALDCSFPSPVFHIRHEKGLRLTLRHQGLCVNLLNI